MRPNTKIGVLVLSVLALALSCMSAFADKKVALVLGNSAYLHTLKLTNPENDARDLADILRKLNFDVIVKTNVDGVGMDNALEEFERKAQGADTALFFFAGHGLQYNGQNYLLPIDAQIEDQVSLRYNTLAIDKVRQALDAAAGVKIMVLDACRNNPLAERLNSLSGSNRGVVITRGLARLDRGEGMVVAYATQADQVAQDGSGRNSPFSSALIRRLQEPNLEIATMFRRVAQDVYEQTGGRQRPELSISLLQDFFLNPQDDGGRQWAQIGPRASEDELKQFISSYPRSPYVRDAQNRLYVLETIRQEFQRADQARRDRERQDAERADAEKRERAQTEMARLAAERLDADRKEVARIAAEKQEQDRLAAAAREAEKAEAQRQADQKREAERLEKERIRLAALEEDNRRTAEIEAARQKQAEACARETADFNRLAAESQPDALATLKAQVSCPGLAASIDKALAKMLKAREQVCADENRALRQIRDGDISAMEKFVAGANCAEARTAGADALATFKAAAARQEAACATETQHLQDLRAQQPPNPQIRVELAKLQGSLTCAGLRPQVAEAIKAIDAEEQQNLEKVRARLAALEASRQRSDKEATEKAASRANCQAEQDRFAALQSQNAAKPATRAELALLRDHLTCADLRPVVSAAIEAIDKEEQQNLEKVKARLAALEASRRQAEIASADQNASCQAETARLAAIKSDKAARLTQRAELKQLLDGLACARLRPEVTAAIDAIDAEEKQLLDKIRDRLTTLEGGKGKADAQSANCDAEAERLAAIKARKLGAAQLHSELTVFSAQMTCESLRAEVDKIIKTAATNAN